MRTVHILGQEKKMSMEVKRLNHIPRRIVPRGKRLISFSLFLTMVFNMVVPVSAEQTSIPSGVVKRTVSWTLDSDGGSVSPLTSEHTVLADNGSVLVNAEGLVNTQVQSVYHADQTLVSVSLAGTSFSFAPLMMENYYPDLNEEEELNEASTEMVQPEATEDTLLSEAQDGLTAQQNQHTTSNTVAPVNSPSPEMVDSANQTADSTLTNQESNQNTSAIPLETTSNPVLTQNPSVTPSPTPVMSQDAVETAIPSQSIETTPTKTIAPTATPIEDNIICQNALAQGYALCEKQIDVYADAYGKDVLGTLEKGEYVYIPKASVEKRAFIVFDTPDGIVEGYALAEKLSNLSESEQNKIIKEAEIQREVRNYDGMPLVQSLHYTPRKPNATNPAEGLITEATETPVPTDMVTEEPVIEATETPAPTEVVTEEPVIEATETPAPTEVVTEEPVIEATETPAPTEAVTEEPVTETTETPAPTEVVTEEPVIEAIETPAPTEVLTEEPVIETTETPAPTEVVTEEPVIESTETPAPTEVATEEPVTETTETPAPTEVVIEEPVIETTETPAPTEAATEEPVIETTETFAPTEVVTEEEPAAETTEAPALTEMSTEELTTESNEVATEESNEAMVPAPMVQSKHNVYSILQWLVPSAYAEIAEAPERPSFIQGQKIQTAARIRSASKSTNTAGISAVLYSGLFDAVTDVRLSVTTTGVKEDVIVHQYTGNHAYSYRLNTDGLRANLSGQTILLYNGAGQCMAQLDAPYMIDASGEYSADISVSLSGGDGNYVITYRPNDNWMRTAAYPVTIDPSGEYLNNIATGIGDVFVSSENPGKHYDHTVPSGSSQQKHNLEGMNLYAGNNGNTSIAFILPGLTELDEDRESIGFPANTPLLIDKATWRFNVHELVGDGKFRISLVNGEWNTATITYANRPALSSDIYVDVQLHTGWNEVDVTKLFSAWFNSMDQAANHGLAVSSSTSWARICASDAFPRSDRMSFSATYYTGISAPTLTAEAYGYETNSESGWVKLSWTKVDGAAGYLVGIYNGKEYEYQYVGNTSSYSTKGKKLWPTDAEITSNKFALHWDGKGQELPTIPRASQSDLNYYFSVIPCNAYSQVAGSDTVAKVNVVLPDRIAPNKPTTVSVSPAGWTTENKAQITWAGVLDLPLNSQQMIGGSIQYTIDPSGSDPTTWSWSSTGKNTHNGTFTLDTSSWSDDVYVVYIRGVDAEGNYGAPKGEYIRIDRTAPTKPTVSVSPSGWTNQANGYVSWDNIDDLNAFRVEYRLDGKGGFTDTKKTTGTYSNYQLDLSKLTEGAHTIEVRGVDSLGNVGKSGSAQIRIDRSAPTLTSFVVTPGDWTINQNVTMSWKGAKDAYSGLKAIAYKIDNGAYQTLTVQQNGSKTLDVSKLSNGTHQITLKLTDNAGYAAEYQNTIYIDRSAPLLASVTVLPATWTAGQQVALSWSGAEDLHSGLAKLAYAVDKSEYQSLTTSKTGTKIINVASLTDGEHAIKLRLTDGVGNTSDHKCSFYIDRTAPTLTSLYVTPDTWTTDKQIKLSWAGAADAHSGLASISCSIDGADYQSLTAKSSGYKSFNVEDYADGLHTIRFKLTDNAGMSAEYQCEFRIDRTAPTLAEAEIAPDMWTPEQQVVLSWTDALDESSGLAEIAYAIDNGEYDPMRLLEDGEQVIDISALADGTHLLTMRLTDRVGLETEIEKSIYVDRTAPELTTLALVPDDWTNSDQIAMNWTGASDACSGLDKIEYKIDDDTYQTLLTVADGETILDVSGLEDGSHTVSFKLTDLAGISAEYTRTMLLDRTAPQVTMVQASPDNWSDTDALTLVWLDAMDEHSGMQKIEYSFDDNPACFTLPLSVSAEEEIDVSAHLDGQHTLLLHLYDEAENVSTEEMLFLIDRTPPVAEILSPADGATVSGVIDIQGTIQDLSLKEWVFTAIGESGQTVSIAGGTEEKVQESLGILDMSAFADGEEVEVMLTAWDEAGHETSVQGIYIKAVHLAQPVDQDIDILSPQNGDILSDATIAEYSLNYQEEEQAGSFYIDSATESAAEQQLPIYPILYPEDSAHSLTAVSMDDRSQMHYSQGFQSALVFADTMQTAEGLEAYSNLVFSASGAEAAADAAEFTTIDYVASRPMVAARLHALANTETGGSVSFDYSTDAGETWHALPMDRDVVFAVPQQTIRVRCALTGLGTLLRGFDLTGIYEANPIRWKAHLLKNVESFAITTAKDSTTAVVDIPNDATEELITKKQYVDGSLHTDSFVLNLLPYAENVPVEIAQSGIDAQGTLYGSGAATSVILRENLNSTELYESAMLTMDNPIYAIRAEALCMDENGTPVSSGLFAYSTDGMAWYDLPLENYVFLPQTAQTIGFRAILPEGVTLRGFHAEGVTLKTSTIVPTLVTEPYNVKADDYGAFDDDERRFELRWDDDNASDSTLPSEVVFDIYRNGELVATVTEKQYTDADYQVGATYQVAARRVYSDPGDGYANILERKSEPVKAAVKVIEPPVPPVIVTPTPVPTPVPTPTPGPATATPAVTATQGTPVPVATSTPQPAATIAIQTPAVTATPTPKPTVVPTTLSPVIITPAPQATPTQAPPTNAPTPKPTKAPLLDFTTENPYEGGNYGTTATDHEVTFELDQSLLGPHRFCSLGFEPINFNTGNFFLQTRDYSMPDLGTGGFDIVRTYNTQSNETNGLFGARWATEYSQHLRLDDDGSIAYRRTDGSEVVFQPLGDGAYTCDTTEYEQLSYDDACDEYRIALTDGSVYGFTSEGLLSRIEKDGGQHVLQIIRNEEGLITSILSPSQEELLVDMDENGHIVRITTPGGAVLTYKYRGNNLVSFTDGEGDETRYKYDSQGRMTEWTDAAGKCQVYNKYDDQHRVVYQEDAMRGKYSLEYHEGYTVTTDAEGNVITYYHDNRKRTTRIVDARGGETSFTYGENGEIVSETDPLGNVTAYAYNEAGDLIATVLPNGGSILKEYDDQHNLIRLTDLNGAVTTYEYDENANLIAETAPNGGITRYTYDHKGRMVSKTDALGHTTSYEYLNGLLTKTTDANGNTTAYTYDAHGNLASMTDALGNTTLYHYNTKGNLLSMTFADGTTIRFTYDAMGRQTSMTDPLGNVTKYRYDALGNLTQTRLPDDTVQTATYTKSYRLASVTDALYNETSYTYDANGNQLTVTDPMGNTTTSEYDLADHLVRETSPTGGVTTYTYDEVGLPLTVTDPTGATQTMTYDLSGNLLSRTLPNGAVITAEYDNMGNVVRQINALGGATTITYDLLGNITSVVDPMGATTIYTYDDVGNLITVTDGMGNTTIYEYDVLNRLVRETAPNGGATTYTYDSVGNLVSTTDVLGNTSTYTYDANANLISITDPLGNTAMVEYDEIGNATAATLKNGGVLTTKYDRVGRISSETDANGNTTKYHYNKNGLVTRIIDARDQQADFAYDALGNITKITAPGNAVTLYTYDAAGRVLTSTDPEGCVTEYGYNDYSQIATLTVNGNTAAYEYDLAGNISAVTDAEGRRVNFTYDQNGNLTQITYPDGTTETTQYDLLGRVVLATPRTGLATAYTYDQLGNVTSVTQGEQITRYEYDLLGRLTKVITPDGAETTYAYDAVGNLVGETDPLGNQTRFAYTVENLLEQVTYANGATQSLTYDLAGNVISETDGEGNTKRYQYDRVNRLTAVIDEAGNKTSYGYDALDNITKVTDALKQVTRYTYDKNGNLLTETDALGNTVEYTYTPEGWLSAITKADGTVLTFAYDKTGNLLTQSTGENQNIESSYNEIGQVTTVTSPEGTITYQYNQQGYLVSVTNGNGDVVSYTYDQYGNKLSMTYPDGRVVSYTYDSMNRMTSVTGLDGEVTTYAYDAAGQPVETASRNLTTEYKYDVVGSLVEQTTTGSSNLSFQYSYNLNGYITGEVRTENGETITSAYAYDPLGELISFTQSTGYGEQYTYDKVGNMTRKVITPLGSVPNEKGTVENAVTLKMRYNQGNQLVSMANGGDKITYKYDKNGSMVQKVLNSKQYGSLTDTYAYNSLDQLVSYTGYDGYQQQFSYDANGMRLSKSEYGNGNRSTLEELLRGEIAGLPEVVVPVAPSEDETAVPEEYEWATTEYLYDITQEYYQVIQQTTTSCNTTATTAYAYGLERIAAYDANNTTQYIYDGRGSVAQTISEPVAGASVSAALPEVQVQSYAYTAFGEQMGSKTSGFGYNAEDFDAATGMINLRMRQYEPALNRFSQKDVYPSNLFNPTSFNRYLFTYNSPISFIDANGMVAVALGTGAASVRDGAVGGAKKNSTRSIANAVSTIVNSTKSVVSTFSQSLTRDRWIYSFVKHELDAVDESRPTCQVEKALIWKRACARYDGNNVVAEETTKQLQTIQSYDKADWLFLTGDCLFDEDISLGDRFAILNVLKEKQDITGDDLVELGFITEEERYQRYFFDLFQNDVASDAAALLELSYRSTREGWTVWDLTIEDMQMRQEQQSMLTDYLFVNCAMGGAQRFNAAANAIRMNGAWIATPGFESVLSDYFDFNFVEYDIKHGYGRFATNELGYFGTAGTSSKVRVINGTMDEAYMLFEHLSNGYISEGDAGYGGKVRRLPDGGVVTYRPDSKSGSPAIDIKNIPGLHDQRIHFE